MKVKIKNFGPIRNANLDLAKTTIIVGDNGSGKSFLAKLLYFLISILPESDKQFKKELDKDPNFKPLHEGKFMYERIVLTNLTEVFDLIDEADLADQLITWGKHDALIENECARIFISKAKPYDVTRKRECKLKKWYPASLIDEQRAAILLAGWVPNFPLGVLSLDRGKYHEDLFNVDVVIDNGSVEIIKNGKVVKGDNASAGALLLLPIEVYIKDKTFKTLIIEDPEMGLDVNTQIKLAKYLSKVKGKNLIITTHSEWIPMVMAFENKDVNIYEIRDGKVERIEVNEDGTIGELMTVNRPEEKELNRIIEKILGSSSHRSERSS